jgi:catechol 2,3-dioxygenase-like lactoylglutathione lyase family enzyme
MNRFVLGSIALLLTLPSVFAQDKVARPRITGIAHVRFYVSDMEKSRVFYKDILGLPQADYRCSDKAHSCFAVSWGPDGQHIELQQEPSPAPEDWLAEISFATDDVLQLRAYLAGHGLNPGPISKTASGIQIFEMHDPEGHLISFVGPAQPMKVDFLRGLPHPVSTHIIHAGFVVKDRAAMDHFYKDILGFRLYWHGGMKDSDTDWAAMQVPDGTDWLEYMLNIDPKADKQELGVMNHISLGVKDIKVAAASLQSSLSKMRADDSPQIGRDGKWQYNLYDPDDTCVELMEFAPVLKPCCSEITGPNPKP